VSTVHFQRAAAARLLRYVFNGLLATGVHYLVLSVLINPLAVRPIGLANLVAAITGTVASFIGNRQFVFKAVNAPVQKQAIHFALLYAILAIIHSACMYLWCDILNRDYQVGFLLATGLQFLLSYIFNSSLVFRNPHNAPNPL